MNYSAQLNPAEEPFPLPHPILANLTGVSVIKLFCLFLTPTNILAQSSLSTLIFVNMAI